MEIETPLPPLKDLASSDPALRRSTLQNLLSYLSTFPPSSHLTAIQSLQIWTTLFYALYMHDPRASSPLSTQTLITTLTTKLLLTTVPKNNPRLKLALTTGFWETMSREWSGIDRHRLDKYLLLIRLMLRATFMLLHDSACSDATEERAVARDQVEVLRTWPLSTGRGGGGGGSAGGKKVPDGIRYHVLDVWVDELVMVLQDDAKTGGEGREEAKKTLVEMTTGLVQGVAADALTKGVRLRARDVLADSRLQEWK